MATGDYDLVIWSVTTFDGDSYEGSEALEYLHDADQVFYSISYGSGEEFYRWVAGPFEDIDSLEAIIADDEDYYSALR